MPQNPLTMPDALQLEFPKEVQSKSVLMCLLKKCDFEKK